MECINLRERFGSRFRTGRDPSYRAEPGDAGRTFVAIHVAGLFEHPQIIHLDAVVKVRPAAHRENTGPPAAEARAAGGVVIAARRRDRGEARFRRRKLGFRLLRADG